MIRRVEVAMKKGEVTDKKVSQPPAHVLTSLNIPLLNPGVGLPWLQKSIVLLTL
jgi:hypothetical protein